jgi:hypothetical protein
MAERGVVSDKQKLIAILETTYLTANSEQDFYNTLEQKGIELYKRNGLVAGIKLKRKYRFKLLGYHRVLLKELTKEIKKDKRLDRIREVRKWQREHKLDRNRKRE